MEILGRFLVKGVFKVKIKTLFDLGDFLKISVLLTDHSHTFCGQEIFFMIKKIKFSNFHFQ